MTLEEWKNMLPTMDIKLGNKPTKEFYDVAVECDNYRYVKGLDGNVIGCHSGSLPYLPTFMEIELACNLEHTIYNFLDECIKQMEVQ